MLASSRGSWLLGGCSSSLSLFLKEGGEAEFALRNSGFTSLPSLSSNLGLLDLNGDGKVNQLLVFCSPFFVFLSAALVLDRRAMFSLLGERSGGRDLIEYDLRASLLLERGGGVDGGARVCMVVWEGVVEADEMGDDVGEWNCVVCSVGEGLGVGC